MALKRCKKCGLPLRLSRDYVWPGNGTIFSRRDPSVRMVLFEAGYYPFVWSQLEERLGFPISDIMIRGQHAAVWDYLESTILTGWLKYALQYMPFKMIVKHIMDSTALFGFGSIEILEYRKGKYLVVRLRNPFDVISLAWGVRGIYELAEGSDSKPAWTPEGDDYILTVTASPGADPRSDVDAEAIRAVREAKRELSLVGKLLPAQEGKYPACDSCGLPSALSVLEWREGEGTIYTRDLDLRYVFSTGHIFIGIVRDLEEKAGKDLEPVIIEITKRYHYRRMQGIPIRARSRMYHEAAGLLFSGGFGNIVNMTYGEGHLEMIVANPFYAPRLVGRIAGLFEYVEGGEADIQYRFPEPQIMELEIRTV